VGGDDSTLHGGNEAVVACWVERAIIDSGTERAAVLRQIARLDVPPGEGGKPPP